MKTWWDDTICPNHPLPTTYSAVSVLLIRWTTSIDELQTKHEVHELRTLFHSRFNYTTRIVELNIQTKPQHQLSNHISAFIAEHDGPDNLLIVYHTGHGVYHEEDEDGGGGYLELSATINPALCNSIAKNARCNWSKAEQQLHDEDVESDVLVILDTCFASNCVKSTSSSGITNFNRTTSGSNRNSHSNKSTRIAASSPTRKSELLAACPINCTTASPGRNSFTRAFITALHSLLEEYNNTPFSTFRLNQRILLDKHRVDTPSLLWARGRGEEHILLAPLEREIVKREPDEGQLVPKAYMALRIGLRDERVSKEQIAVVAKTLRRAIRCEDVEGVRGIEWVDFRPCR